MVYYKLSIESDEYHNLKVNIVWYGIVICIIVVILIIGQPILNSKFGTTELTGTKNTYLVGEEITSYKKDFLGASMSTINTAYYSGYANGDVMISMVVFNDYGFTSFDLHIQLGTIIQLGERTFKVTSYNHDSLELMDISADALYKDVTGLFQ